MRHLWQWLCGYVCIVLHGRQINRFLNLCSKNDIQLWKISRDIEYAVHAVCKHQGHNDGHGDDSDNINQGVAEGALKGINTGKNVIEMLEANKLRIVTDLQEVPVQEGHDNRNKERKQCHRQEHNQCRRNKTPAGDVLRSLQTVYTFFQTVLTSFLESLPATQVSPLAG